MPKHSDSSANRQRRRVLSQFGENIRRERRRKGLSQKKLAELAGLHPRVVQKMESAESNILATTLVRIQHVLGCPWEQLMSNLEKFRIKLTHNRHGKKNSGTLQD